MGIPETEKPHSDAIDLITDACYDLVPVLTEDGKTVLKEVMNRKKVYYKTQLVGYTGFPYYVKLIEILDSMADACKWHMSGPKAKVLSEQIKRNVEVFKLTIDAESSKTMRDDKNSQSSLIHIVSSNKVERHYTMDEELKKSLWGSLFGGDQAKDNK